MGASSAWMRAFYKQGPEFPIFVSRNIQIEIAWPAPGTAGSEPGGNAPGRNCGNPAKSVQTPGQAFDRFGNQRVGARLVQMALDQRARGRGRNPDGMGANLRKRLLLGLGDLGERLLLAAPERVFERAFGLPGDARGFLARVGQHGLGFGFRALLLLPEVPDTRARGQN